MAAPSACNQQPWEFYVGDKDVILQLSKASPYATCAKRRRSFLCRVFDQRAGHRNILILI